MAKKLSFGPNFGPFEVPNLFSKIWLCMSLDIVVNYHHVQYQKKTDGQMDRQTDRDRQMDQRTD